MTDSYVLFQESRESQRHIMELERELGQQSVELESLTEDKVRLMREIAQLRAGNTRQAEENMSSSAGRLPTSRTDLTDTSPLLFSSIDATLDPE